MNFEPVGAAVHDGGVDVLDLFSPATRGWFAGAFAAPTPAQEGAWRAAAAGEHALVVAPTGSGKTLAAFLWALDRLAVAGPQEEPMRRCRVLYVSPLKALAVDVERNLRSPLAGIRQATQDPDEPRQPAKLLYMSPLKSRFLFCDRGGRKVLGALGPVAVKGQDAVDVAGDGPVLGLDVEVVQGALV